MSGLNQLPQWQHFRRPCVLIVSPRFDTGRIRRGGISARSARTRFKAGATCNRRRKKTIFSDLRKKTRTQLQSGQRRALSKRRSHVTAFLRRLPQSRTTNPPVHQQPHHPRRLHRPPTQQVRQTQRARRTPPRPRESPPGRSLSQQRSTLTTLQAWLSAITSLFLRW